LFLVTSTVGRAWCGYACPQTVWVDLFLVVERAIEGDRNARMKLEAGPWSLDKLWKRTLKHGVWLLIGVATGGAWIYYFADAPTLVQQVVTLQAPVVAYGAIALLTATTYVFGGLMREQVCTYMCPWPRIQGAMLDENSLTVTYNDWRGEPRSRHAKKALAEAKAVGDCVDCEACVVVCPMGIDIRDGQQLECITCALCIDACDDVMTKLGKETGLISYVTLADYNRNMALATGGGPTIIPANVRDATGRLVDAIKHTKWQSIVRPRTVVYFLGWAAIGLAMLTALSLRTTFSVSVLHDRNPLYVVLKDGAIRNGFDLKITNMAPHARSVSVHLEGLPGAVVYGIEVASAPSATLNLTVDADKVADQRLFVEVPVGSLPRSVPAPLEIIVTDAAGQATARAQTVFQAPEPSK
jgi:cytochrome c oxidase accessory protein FixG